MFNFKKIERKHIWPGVATLGSAYFSIVAAAGVLVGYVATRAFLKKYYDTGKVESIKFKLLGKKIHYHHWAMGATALVLIPVIGSFSGCPKVLIGLIGGVIADDFEDIYQPVRAWIKTKTKL